MNCRKARTWMLLADTGELPEDRRTLVDRHAAACAECRRYAASLAALRGEYAAESAATATPPPTLDAILTAAREAAVRPAAPAPALRLRWTWPERALAAAAALLAVVGLAAALLRRNPAPAQTAAPAAPAIEQQVAAAVAGIEADWSALDGELALTALEIGEWLSSAAEPVDDAFSGRDSEGAGT